MHAGDYFGERSLTRGTMTSASVTAVGACTMMRMTMPAFVRLLGPVLGQEGAPPLRRYDSLEGDDESPRSVTSTEAAAAEAAALPPYEFARAQGPVRLSDFTASAKPLGEGGWGRVRLCRHKESGALYAMKDMLKTALLRGAHACEAS